MGEAEIFSGFLANTGIWTMVLVMLSLEEWNVEYPRAIALAGVLFNLIITIFIILKGV